MSRLRLCFSKRLIVESLGRDRIFLRVVLERMRGGLFLSRLFDNKKGASVDSIWIIVLFFGTVIALVTITLFWNIASGIDLWTATSQGTVIRNNTQDYVNLFDYMMVMFYFGLHLGVIIMGWLLRSHPVFFIVSIFFEILVMIISVPLSSAWAQFSTTQGISLAAAAYPSTNYVMLHLPELEMVWMIVACIFFYGFAKSGGFDGA